MTSKDADPCGIPKYQVAVALCGDRSGCKYRWAPLLIKVPMECIHLRLNQRKVGMGSPSEMPQSFSVNVDALSATALVD